MNKPIEAKNLFERNPKKTVIFFILLTGLALDVTLGKLFIPLTQLVRNSYYHHELKRNFKGRLSGRYCAYGIYTNSFAFKDKSRRKIETANSKYRILFIGDSFTEGVNLPYEKTFVGIIDQGLDKNNFEVLNAGVSSFSPKLYYLKIKHLLETIGLKFDELNVFIDISDIQNEIGYENYFPSEEIIMHLLVNVHVFFKQNSFIYYSLHELYRNSSKCSNKQEAWKNKANWYANEALWTNDEKLFKAWGRKGLKLAKENMDNLYNLCKKNRIELTIAVYPWPIQIKNRELNSKQAVFWQAFCKKRDIDFINFFPDFINDSASEEVISNYYIKDDVHFNENGHRLIAEKWLRLFSKRR